MCPACEQLRENPSTRGAHLPLPGIRTEQLRNLLWRSMPPLNRDQLRRDQLRSALPPCATFLRDFFHASVRTKTPTIGRISPSTGGCSEL